MTLFSEFENKLQVLKVILYYNVACMGDFKNVIPFFSKYRNVFLTILLYCLQFVEIELGGDGGLAIEQFIRNSA